MSSNEPFSTCAPPKNEASPPPTFARLCEAHGIGTDLRLRVSQVSIGGTLLDTKDRVQLGAALLRDLIGAGL